MSTTAATGPDPARVGSERAGTSTRPIRVAMVQSIVPLYRVPVFNRLSEEPGIDLTVFTGTDTALGSLDSAADRGHFRVAPAPQTLHRGLVSQPGMLAAARSPDFDVLVVPWNTRVIQLFPSLIAARRAGKGTVLFGHGYSKNEGRLRRWLRNAALHRATVGLLYNHMARESLVAQGFPRERLFVALNAVDQTPVQAARSHWLSQPEALERFRREQGIVGRELAVFVSRIEPDKRVEILLEAFAHLRRRRPQAVLALIGKGSVKGDMERRAADLGIAERTRFLGPIYDDMELAPWMLSAAALAYPAAIGLSILHAFGFGLPVVTSDDIASHNPEIEALRPAENGLLYRAGDPEHFAERLDECMAGGEAWERLSQNALATVQGPNGFTVDRMVRGIVEALRYADQARRKRASARTG